MIIRPFLGSERYTNACIEYFQKEIPGNCFLRCGSPPLSLYSLPNIYIFNF